MRTRRGFLVSLVATLVLASEEIGLSKTPKPVAPPVKPSLSYQLEKQVCDMLSQRVAEDWENMYINGIVPDYARRPYRRP